jgi:anti-anti-sigma factor
MGTDLVGNDLKENRAGHFGGRQSQTGITGIQEFELHHDDLREAFERNPFLPDHDEVTVQRLPERLSSDEGQRFFHQVQKLLNTTTQPHFVFDFAQVLELDAVGIHLLLQCLEEVMKVNGDVKLAAVPSAPASVLEQTGVDSLFEIFDSTADAVQSFHYVPAQEWAIPVPLNATPSPAVAAPAACGAD